MYCNFEDLLFPQIYTPCEWPPQPNMLARLWVVLNGAVTDPNCIIDYDFEYIFDLFKGIHDFLKMNTFYITVESL
jgi:hypothetical protein